MRFITIDSNNKIVGIRYGAVKVMGEIESEEGELGQVMQADRSFITPEPEIIEQQATIEEQILAESQYQAALLEMNMMGGM